MRVRIAVLLLVAGLLVDHTTAGELAGVDFGKDSLGYQVQRYHDGTPYVWLGLQSLRLLADVRPSADHKVMLLWGAKGDERTGVVSVNGIRRTVVHGGYRGFRWLAVPVPAGVAGDHYDLRLSPPAAGGKLAFVAQIRLVTADTPAGQLANELPPGIAPFHRPPQPKVELTAETRHFYDPAPTRPDWERARRSARYAGIALDKVQRWLRDRCLPARDKRSGLFRATGAVWNYRDTAADCYPFYVWAAYFTDPHLLNTVMIDTLAAEQKLCNHLGRLPVRYDMDKQERIVTPYDTMMFGASEYVKDGLVPIVELLGPQSPWFKRMQGIVDDMFQYARYDTPAGKIPSQSLEVNGELLQVLPRLYSITRDPKYLDWADRVADLYLRRGQFVPSRLSDHGCEIIGGLGLLFAVERRARPARARALRPHLEYMFDEILRRGTNSDGIIVGTLQAAPGPHDNVPTRDGWGYDYVAYLDYDLALDGSRYTEAIRKPLGNLLKPRYENFTWNDTSRDNLADSVEGGLYLLRWFPTPAGFCWADREIARTLVDHTDPDRLWGTNKLEANTVRTVLIHTMLHTRNVIARPWQPGLRLGAAPVNKGICVFLQAETGYVGRLQFDVPRHRLYMHFDTDWPRLNTMPEWFTVVPDDHHRYSLEDVDTGTRETATGRQLSRGWPVRVEAGKPLRWVVQPTT